MKIDLGAIIAAVQQAIVQTAKSLFEQAMRFASELIMSPFTLLASAAGITGEQRIPAQAPKFETPGDVGELIDEMANGHARKTVVRDLDRDSVNSVFKLAKMSKDDRATADLSAIDRADVRAALFSMTTAELEALTKAGPGAVRLLLTEGDSRVWGVPTVASVPTASVMPPLDTELSRRLRKVKEAMAAPKGSAPFTMPRM